mgnify:CR=1 FL=1
MVITRYSKAFGEKEYDTIVIGSGMGGMAAAGILARFGQRVLVLEKHYIAGGLTHSFKRKRFEWDVGMHYIGNVHDKEHILRQTFDFISGGKLKWSEIETSYDKICINHQGQKNHIHFGAGKKQFIDSLLTSFPEEEPAINRYLELIEKVNDASEFYFAERLLPPWIGKILYPLLSKKFRFYSDQTTQQAISKLTNNHELIHVLTTRYGNYGLPPGKSSFAMHALVVYSYLEGANYPIGGTSEVANTVSEVIGKSGGSVVVDAEVEKIILKKNKAIGVQMADGTQIFSKRVISNAGYENTTQKLLPLSDKQRKKLKLSSEQQIKPSTGHMALYVGLEGAAEELGLDKANHWLSDSGDHDKRLEAYVNDPEQNFPFVFISSPSTKDPLWSAKNPDISTVTMIVPASFSWFEKWQDKPWGKRGEEYDALKSQFCERLLAQLYNHLPNTRGKVKWNELSTPLSTAHFCQRDFGAMYGFEHSPERFKQRWVRPASPVKGLFMVGQDMVTVGVTAATMSAVLATSLILRTNMMNALPKAHKKDKEVI